MIKKNLLFILGAGASIPYGFPSGLELFKKVIDIRSDANTMKILCEMGHKEAEIIEFRDALHLSGRTSVDAFLEYRTEYMNIGKEAMAAILISYEKISKLFTYDSNWYNYMFGKLNCDFEKFNKNKVSFITFNYDRSLETYLFTALKNSYGKSDEDCAEKLSNIPIIHLHGKLCSLPWQDEGSYKRNYSSDVTITDIKNCARMISIIHENIDENEEFNQAHGLIKNSDYICFLGFGYSPVNLERLKILQHAKNSTKIIGSSLGLTNKEKSIIKEMLDSRIDLYNYTSIRTIRRSLNWVDLQTY